MARVIWADMLSIAVTYFITLCLFPGLESEIRHCVLGEWLPILVMAVFNLSDFVGKVRHGVALGNPRKALVFREQPQAEGHVSSKWGGWKPWRATISNPVLCGAAPASWSLVDPSEDGTGTSCQLGSSFVTQVDGIGGQGWRGTPATLQLR